MVETTETLSARDATDLMVEIERITHSGKPAKESVAAILAALRSTSRDSEDELAALTAERDAALDGMQQCARTIEAMQAALPSRDSEVREAVEHWLPRLGTVQSVRDFRNALRTILDRSSEAAPSCVDCGGDHPSGHPWHTPPASEAAPVVGLRAICVICGNRGRVRSSGGTVLVGEHDDPAGHLFTPATDFEAARLAQTPALGETPSR